MTEARLRGLLQQPIPRRGLLRSGVAAAAIAAGGCARLHLGLGPTAVVTRTPLVVAAHDLLPVAGPLAAAWESAHRSSRLVVRSDMGPPPTYETPGPGFSKADIGETSGDGMLWGGPNGYVNLAPLVHQANFDLGRLMPSGVRAFALGGDLFGLPLLCDPFVVMANTDLLQAVGVTHPAGQPWTLAEIEAAVVAARASPSVPKTAQLIGGSPPWTDIRLWGAVVLGLGGALTDANGALDLTGKATVAATTALIELANTANRSGVSQDPAAVGFVYRTFSGAASQTLFAIEPDFPNPVGGSVGVTGPENRFPLLPSSAVIPTFKTYGLSVLAHSTQPSLAVEFILWLYELRQQQLLLTAGVPPMVTDQPALQVAWSHATPGGQNVGPLFDPAHVVDVAGLLPQDGYVVTGEYGRSLEPALLDAARHPENVAADLLQAQNELTQFIAQSAARQLCLLSHVAVQDCPPPPK